MKEARASWWKKFSLMWWKSPEIEEKFPPKLKKLIMRRKRQQM
jgi:hypothetical protein